MEGKVNMPAKKGSKSTGPHRKGGSSRNSGASAAKSKGGNKNHKNPNPPKGSVSNKRAILDHYSLQAQKEGYPARSVYKLEEIQKKFNIFPREGRIMDVGAAPGSWSLYILRNTGPKGVLAAVDLKPVTIDDDPRFHFLAGDFFDDANLASFAEWGPYDAILSDAAPATTGNRTIDTGTSAALVEGILFQAQKLLKLGGNFVVKIFQGGDEQAIMAQMRECFESARMFKPKACRKESFETYLVGLKFKGNKNIET